jgi:hypothetical protein
MTNPDYHPSHSHDANEQCVSQKLSIGMLPARFIAISMFGRFSGSG